jgi:hypothetical protein
MPDFERIFTTRAGERKLMNRILRPRLKKLIQESNDYKVNGISTIEIKVTLWKCKNKNYEQKLKEEDELPTLSMPRLPKCQDELDHRVVIMK